MRATFPCTITNTHRVIKFIEGSQNIPSMLMTKDALRSIIEHRITPYELRGVVEDGSYFGLIHQNLHSTVDPFYLVVPEGMGLELEMSDDIKKVYFFRAHQNPIFQFMREVTL